MKVDQAVFTPRRTLEIAGHRRPGRYGFPALKASRISAQMGPDRLHQARCAAAAPVRSAETIDGSGFESIATPF